MRPVGPSSVFGCDDEHFESRLDKFEMSRDVMAARISTYQAALAGLDVLGARSNIRSSLELQGTVEPVFADREVASRRYTGSDNYGLELHEYHEICQNEGDELKRG